MKAEERALKSVYNLTESLKKNPCVYIIYLQIMVSNGCWSLTTGAPSNQPRSNLWVFTILPLVLLAKTISKFDRGEHHRD